MKVLLICLVLFANVWGMSDLEGVNDKDEILLGTIIDIVGKAKLVSDSGKSTLECEDKLYAGNQVSTKAGSKVVVELVDSSKLVLNELSMLTFVDKKTLDQNRGEIYYKIEKRAKLKGLRIKTPFSIIGIKGTELIVDVNTSNREIALNEGLIGIESLQAEFELYKQKVMADFEEDKRKEMEDYEAFKNQGQEEVATYVKSFDLQANKVLHFGDGLRVNESNFTNNIAKRFKYYQDIIQ